MALLAFAAAGPVAAADLGVDPVKIELSRQQQTVAITIGNASDEPSTVQIQAVAWSQRDGKDIYTPTKELLVAPPIVTIAGKSEQIIRTGLRRQADPSRELSYRIFIQDLPTPPAPGFRGLQVALRIGLPVFVMPLNGLAAPEMTWSVAPIPAYGLRLTMQNRGNGHVQVSDFTLHATGQDAPIAGESGASYVLAGQTRIWLLKTNPARKLADGRLRLLAHTDAGDVDVALELAH